jgi:hypothetical protein
MKISRSTVLIFGQSSVALFDEAEFSPEFIKVQWEGVFWEATSKLLSSAYFYFNQGPLI